MECRSTKELKLIILAGFNSKRSINIEHVTIYSHTHGVNPRSEPRDRKKINAGVWIGSHALIMENCREIGYGSVVAAASVVTKVVPAHVIVGGNPAKLIRDLSGV